MSLNLVEKRILLLLKTESENNTDIYSTVVAQSNDWVVTIL